MSLKDDLASQPEFFLAVKQCFDHARLNGSLIPEYVREIRDGLDKYVFPDKAEADLRKALDEGVALGMDKEAVKAWAGRWSAEFELGF